MGEQIVKRFEGLVKKQFYKTYNITFENDDSYIIRGGIISSKDDKNRRKRKKYCATNYMKINKKTCAK